MSRAALREVTALPEALEHLRAQNQRAFNKLANRLRLRGVPATPARLVQLEIYRQDAERKERRG
ncbi:MAG: hypothetical protein V3V08_23505 [Nannocystaceae bacterium]